ncbi:MAG: diguanylate cyclase, partial [Coriobacteriales bacterium]|nr:diguanylate cyclase [Coriobacteriales bacterium]
MLHANNPAVSAVAFLLVSPLLFYDRPARLCAMNALVVALFCMLVAQLKNPDVAEIDIWNMITFGMVSLAITVSIMNVKMRALSQTRQIEFLSQTDLLTGAKNRNHYENQLPGYLGRCASSLACVYADVNGLHETNNEQGHQAGDAMLRETAEAMRRCFGDQHVYRIGGFCGGWAAGAVVLRGQTDATRP